MPSTACSLPRDLVAATLQRAMTRARSVRLTLTGPAQVGGRVELVGDVARMSLHGDVDELAPADQVTFRLREAREGHRVLTPPIALERVRSIELV